jgi:hypothetical protein
MAAMPASIQPHSWFQFRLGTMFVLVTILAVWLGWELHFVHARRAFVARLEPLGFDYYADRSDFVDPAHRPWKAARNSSWRQWLGDKNYSEIIIPAKWSHEEVEHATRLFPEAKVCQIRRLDFF